MMKSLSSLIIIYLFSIQLSGQTTPTFANSFYNANLEIIKPSHTLLNSLPYAGSIQSIMHQKNDYLKIYHDGLGIFCKAENEVSKNAPMQLRMRLGNLEYVDRMEGKIK